MNQLLASFQFWSLKKRNEKGDLVLLLIFRPRDRYHVEHIHLYSFEVETSFQIEAVRRSVTGFIHLPSISQCGLTDGRPWFETSSRPSSASSDGHWIEESQTADH